MWLWGASSALLAVTSWEAAASQCMTACLRLHSRNVSQPNTCASPLNHEARVAKKRA